MAVVELTLNESEGSAGSRAGSVPAGVVALGARRTKGQPVLAGSGFVVHGDDEQTLICSCTHILLDVIAASAAEEGMLNPMIHGVAIGSGDPVTWGLTARVEHFSPPPRHPLAPAHQPPLHHPQLDLCILVINEVGPAATLAAMPLGDSEVVRAGDDLILLGYGQPGVRGSLIGTAGASEQVSATVTRGVCAGIVEDEESGDWFKTDALMLPGHSGSAVLSRAGLVIGWGVSSALDNVVGGGGSYACGLSVVRPVNYLLPPLGAGAPPRARAPRPPPSQPPPHPSLTPPRRP